MVEVYAVKIDQTIDSARFGRFMACVGQEKRDRIQRFYRIEDQQRALIGDILIRFLLCNKLLLDNNALIFEKTEFGKPFLVNDHKIHYNISHSGEWVLGAIHYLPVGVDVEKIQPLDYQLAARFFSEAEYFNLNNKEGQAKLEYFYEIWTLKESYIKAVGKGLSIPLESFSININEAAITVETIKGPGKYYFNRYQLDQGYKVAVCAMENTFKERVKVINTDELYDWALLA
ncbi:MAG: 4'-phosphopantetheinyl transferase superfamily protein [Firmicutes bacterium]|nr:4'-phosphopantetheinyl transferase superfamily protein [Bacillota bacterium]